MKRKTKHPTAAADTSLLICYLYKSGWTMADIARVFKVSRQRIDQIIPKNFRKKYQINGQGLNQYDKYKHLIGKEQFKISQEIGLILDDYGINRIHLILFGERFNTRENQVGNRKTNFIKPSKRKTIVTMWNSGMNFPTIREELKVTTNFISTTLATARKKGLKVRYAYAKRKLKG